MASTLDSIPGSNGWPLLGEALSFSKNAFDFMSSRVGEHGPVCRTNLAGTKAVILGSPDGAYPYVDPAITKRHGSFPSNVLAIFGGSSLPDLDGDVHAGRKRTVLSAFTRSALTAYLASGQTIVARAAERWADSDEVRLTDETQSLAIEIIGKHIFGLDAGPELDALGGEYAAITAGILALPINLPFTTYGKARKAVDRTKARLLAMVQSARRDGPADPKCGMARILAAAGSSPEMPEMRDEDVVLELHHLVLAGFIVFAAMTEMMRRLEANPGMRQQVLEELAATAPEAAEGGVADDGGDEDGGAEGLGTLTIERLAAMTWCKQLVDEVKRITWVVPCTFGIARADFEHGGYTIPEGTLLMLPLNVLLRDGEFWTQPQQFDPDRFSAERAEQDRHPHAFCPQGAGPPLGHRCAGLDYSTMLLQVFASVLTAGYTWSLPAQDLAMNWKTSPPVPRDRVRAVIERRPPVA